MSLFYVLRTVVGAGWPRVRRWWLPPRPPRPRPAHCPQQQTRPRPRHQKPAGRGGGAKRPALVLAVAAVAHSVTNLNTAISSIDIHHFQYFTSSLLMQMWASHWKASTHPNVCAFLKAVMTMVKPLLAVPQLSVW